MKNPSSLEIVMRLYESLEKKKVNLSEKDLNFLKIYDPVHDKRELSQYQDLMKKYYQITDKKPANFNCSRIDHLKNIEKNPFQHSKGQLEHDLFSFLMKNCEKNEIKGKIKGFFACKIKNKELHKFEEGFKGKLSRILKGGGLENVKKYEKMGGFMKKNLNNRTFEIKDEKKSFFLQKNYPNTKRKEEKNSFFLQKITTNRTFEKNKEKNSIFLQKTNRNRTFDIKEYKNINKTIAFLPEKFNFFS